MIDIVPGVGPDLEKRYEIPTTVGWFEGVGEFDDIALRKA